MSTVEKNSFNITLRVNTIEKDPNTNLTKGDILETHQEIFEAIRKALWDQFENYNFAGLTIDTIEVRRGYNDYAKKYRKNKP